MRWPGSVSVTEVGPRDGFQMEAGFIPTDVKVRLINALALTGLHEIQATSFVHPKAIPQLRFPGSSLRRWCCGSDRRTA